MTSDRPLDLLNEAKNKRVLVELKNKQRYVGVLKAFDIHINTVIDEAQEIDEEGNPKRSIGKVFLRGDTIVIISSQ
jgi:small nuclear ribonucleoprotein